MTESSTSALIPASEAFGHRAELSIHLIVGAIPLLGSLLQALLDPIAYLFGALLGALSNAPIFTAFLNALPNNTLKNAYVAGTVGFFLIFTILGGLLPPLLPIIVLVAFINSGVAALLGGIFGLLADLLGGGQT